MENKYISIDDLIKLQSKYSKEYNEYIGFITSAFRNILNPNLNNDFMNSQKQVEVNRTRLISKSGANLLEVEYTVVGKNEKSCLNLLVDNDNKFSISSSNDELPISKRINGNLLPIINDITNYTKQNEFCEQNHIETIYKDINIELDACDIFVTFVNENVTVNHSFETTRRSMKENCSVMTILHNGMRFDLFNETDISNLYKILSIPMIDIEKLPNYLKNDLNIDNEKFKKKV